jgi:hypothetical protein
VVIFWSAVSTIAATAVLRNQGRGTTLEIPALVYRNRRPAEAMRGRIYRVFLSMRKLEAIPVVFNLEGGCLHGLLARVGLVIAFH